MLGKLTYRKLLHLPQNKTERPFTGYFTPFFFLLFFRFIVVYFMFLNPYEFDIMRLRCRHCYDAWINYYINWRRDTTYLRNSTWPFLFIMLQLPKSVIHCNALVTLDFDTILLLCTQTYVMEMKQSACLCSTMILSNINMLKQSACLCSTMILSNINMLTVSFLCCHASSTSISVAEMKRWACLCLVTSYCFSTPTTYMTEMKRWACLCLTISYWYATHTITYIKEMKPWVCLCLTTSRWHATSTTT